MLTKFSLNVSLLDLYIIIYYVKYINLWSKINKSVCLSLLEWIKSFQILTTAVHEDGYELSLTVNFALRGNNDPFVGQKTGLSHADFLSTYTQGRKASISSFTSHDSLGTWWSRQSPQILSDGLP